MRGAQRSSTFECFILQFRNFINFYLWGKLRGVVLVCFLKERENTEVEKYEFIQIIKSPEMTTQEASLSLLFPLYTWCFTFPIWCRLRISAPLSLTSKSQPHIPTLLSFLVLHTYPGSQGPACISPYFLSYFYCT